MVLPMSDQNCDQPVCGNRAALLLQVFPQSSTERDHVGRPEVRRRKSRLRRRRPKRECNRLKRIEERQSLR